MIRPLVPALTLGLAALLASAPAPAADLRMPRRDIAQQRLMAQVNEYVVYVSSFDGRTAAAETVDTASDFLFLGVARCQKVAVAFNAFTYLDATLTGEELAELSGGTLASPGDVGALRNALVKDARACHFL